MDRDYTKTRALRMIYTIFMTLTLGTVFTMAFVLWFPFSWPLLLRIAIAFLLTGLAAYLSTTRIV
jgi:hypothetical protein